MKNFFKKKTESFTQSKGPKQGSDNLWAAIRRLNAQVDALSAKLNAVQTMAMRIDKKLYREKEQIAPSNSEPKEELDFALFR